MKFSEFISVLDSSEGVRVVRDIDGVSYTSTHTAKYFAERMYRSGLYGFNVMLVSVTDKVISVYLEEV